MLTLQGENPTSGPVIVLSCIWSEWHHHSNHSNHSNHPKSLPPEVQKTHPRIGKPHNGAPFFSSHQFSERDLERWKLWKPLATGEWKSLSRRVQPDVPVPRSIRKKFESVRRNISNKVSELTSCTLALHGLASQTLVCGMGYNWHSQVRASNRTDSSVLVLILEAKY